MPVVRRFAGNTILCGIAAADAHVDSPANSRIQVRTAFGVITYSQ